MQLRYAVALPLVGWYLMVPPLRPAVSNLYLHGSIPTSEWQTLGVFAKLADCEGSTSTEVRKRIAAAHLVVRNLGVPDRLESEWKEAGSQAKCIAADDPRLKGD
jgi:hypothetical protein